MAHGPERVAASEDQEHCTVRETPDSMSLPSPAELIVRSQYTRGSHDLNSLGSGENAGRIVVGFLEKGANHQNRALVFGRIIGSTSCPFAVTT